MIECCINERANSMNDGQMSTIDHDMSSLWFPMMNEQVNKMCEKNYRSQMIHKKKETLTDEFPSYEN